MILYAQAYQTKDSVLQIEKEEIKNFNTKIYLDSTQMQYDSIIQPLTVNKNYYDSLIASKDFSYVKNGVHFKKKNNPDKKENTNNFWIEYGKYIVASMVFLAVLILVLKNGSFLLFKRNAKKLAVKDLNQLDIENENIFTINYTDAIKKAEDNADYRLAVRLRFLQSLKKLSEKKLIQYADDKTNHSYLMELGNSPIRHDFFTIVRSYEYIWYGFFAIDEMQYQSISAGFKKFISKI